MPTPRRRVSRSSWPQLRDSIWRTQAVRGGLFRFTSPVKKLVLSRRLTQNQTKVATRPELFAAPHSPTWSRQEYESTDDAIFRQIFTCPYVRQWPRLKAARNLFSRAPWRPRVGGAVEVGFDQAHRVGDPIAVERGGSGVAGFSRRRGGARRQTMISAMGVSKRGPRRSICRGRAATGEASFNGCGG